MRTNPDVKKAELHLEKAEHNLRAARYLEEGRFSDWSVSAFFYCNYHCFLAILASRGYESRNQECTVAAVEMLNENGTITLKRSLIAALKRNPEESMLSLREKCPYGVMVEFGEKEELHRLDFLCGEMLHAAHDIVHARPQGNA